MNSIKINITQEKTQIIWGIPSYEGIISLGDFQERIIIPLDHWTREDYERQWEEGLERIKTEKQSCLVAGVQDPITHPLVNWWLLYKEDSKIYVQNQILFQRLYCEAVM